MMIHILESYEGNSVSFNRYKTIEEAQEKLLEWEQDGMSVAYDKIHSFKTLSRAFIFLLKKLNEVGSTNNEV
tara:strand:+ start:900 stop:1115 length:216 start_codon:yes stop_codon:yes gene_type:complete